MLDNSEYIALKEEYEEYAAHCSLGMRLAQARLENLKEIIERSEERNPFSSISSRIKTFDSAIEKAERKGIDLNIDAIKKRIRDIAGIRIIVPFRDDILKVANYITKVPGINVVDKKDYLKYPKENGYSSLHLIVQVEIYDPTNGSELIPIEVQIRDKGMDFWATIEHIVRYKSPSPSDETEALFRDAASKLNEVAELFMRLRDS